MQKAICTVSLTFSGAETDSGQVNVCMCVPQLFNTSIKSLYSQAAVSGSEKKIPTSNALSMSTIIVFKDALDLHHSCQNTHSITENYLFDRL